MKKIISRLKRINGQVSALETLLDGKHSCEAALIQFVAVKSAFDSALSEFLTESLKGCVNSPASKKKIQRLAKVMSKN